MEDEPRSRASGEYLLHENRVREILQSMYHAFDSTENACLLIEKLPGEITEDEFKGDKWRRKHMKWLCEWLHIMSMLTKDNEIYMDMFLDPVRSAAHARLSMSNMATRSTRIEALVFASKPYRDTVFNAQRIMMSVVAPSLQAPMTVNVTSNGDLDPRPGYYVFDHCQPMPLVNRIQQTKGSIQLSKRQVNLAEYDYLYTPLDDIGSLGRSLELENFCEVPTNDANESRRLAAPFVTFGKVVAVNGPSVRVGQLAGSRQVTMMAVNQASVLSGLPPENFEGKTVRMLGVQWYEPSGSHYPPPEHPAIYCIEVDDNVDTLRVQEECGRVRLRGRVNHSTIPANLLESVTKLSCISSVEKNISYVYRPSTDPVVSYFLYAHSKIRELRIKQKINAVQVTEDQVIDRQKSGIEGLARLSTSKKYFGMAIALMDFVAQNDIYGEYADNATSKLLDMTPNYRRKQMSFLRHLRIIKEVNSDHLLTKKGKGVALKVAQILSRRIPPVDIPVVIGPDSLLDGGIPPSLALSIIKNEDLGKYNQANVGGVTTETYWIKEGLPTELENQSQAYEKYALLMRSVLSIMGKKDHPLGAAKIAELLGDRLRASSFTIDIMLSELCKSETGQVRRNGDTWEYPIPMRVSDLFDHRRSETMSLDDVVERINVATSPSRRSEVYAAIDALVKDRKIYWRGAGFINSSYIRAKKDELKSNLISFFDFKKMDTMSKADVVKTIDGGSKWEAEIRVLMDDLVLDGTIVEIDRGIFTHNSEIKSKKDFILRDALRVEAMKKLSDRRDVDENEIIDALMAILDQGGAKGDYMEKASYVRGVLNEMEKSGKIWLNGSRYVRDDA